MKTSVCKMCGEEFIPGAEITPANWGFKLTRFMRYLFLLVVLWFILWASVSILSAAVSIGDTLISGALLVVLVIVGALVLSIPRKSRFGRDGRRFYCPACIKRTSVHLWQRIETPGQEEA